MLVYSHASAVAKPHAVPPSWASLQVLGTMKLYLGNVSAARSLANCVNGTMFAATAGLFCTSVK